MEAHILNSKITFEMNGPIEETGFISENFDFLSKPAYATVGISEIISRRSDVQPVIFEIFRIFRNEASKRKLDYLQKMTIDGVNVWCIDNGSEIAILRPSEY